MTLLARINDLVEKWSQNRCPDCGRKLVCHKCGSVNVQPHGWPNRNHRHHCMDCGDERWI